MDYSKINLVKDLPISKYEEEISHLINQTSNLIVIGETGSGKTTQIPLILLKTLGKYQDLKKVKIAVTEPRRIAATSVAKYVSSLVGEDLGKTVGYKIRFSEAKSDLTQLLFMTDGLLIREAQIDPLLLDYSVIMIDEAHERNINSDFLIGLLVDIQKSRKEKSLVPLKILVTSATLEKEKFLNYFSKLDEPYDSLEVPGRLFPVEINLEERDVYDYERAAAEKINYIHYELAKDKKGDILVFMPGKGEIEKTKAALQPRQGEVATQDFEIITIHADLPIEEQNKIFQESDKRKVIIATNIAETSLTVPGIVYVVDSGLIKSMDFDPRTGINSLVTKPHAKKGLEQRRGRAGRIEPGVYFGLYTQKSFYQRPEFPTAEILRSSLSQIVLVMIMLGIKEIESFKFIDMPDNHLIQVALNQLIKLGAIDSDRNITEKGIKMASLPMEPILANFILEAEKNQCVSTICSIAAFLEMKPVFINQNQEEILKNLIEERLNEKNGGEDQIEDLEESEMQELVRKAYDIYNDMLNRHRNLQHKGSDFLTLKKVLDLWEEQDDKEEWARKNYLNYESLVEASSIKQELLDICVQNKINVRDDISSRLIKKVDKTIIQAFKFNILSRMKNGFYRNIASKEKNIRIHNSSVVREEKPKFLVAFEIIEISEIDAPPKLSSKFLHEINDELMQRFFPEVYRYEMEFEKRRNRERFNKNNGHKFRLRKGHVGRRGKNPRKRR